MNLPFIFNKDVSAKQITENINRKILAHEENLMLCELEVTEGPVGVIHEHEHEQIAYVVSGVIEFILGEQKSILRAGDSVFIPSNIPHGATCIEKAKILDIFTPERKDFL